jgi:hypothetical protein
MTGSIASIVANDVNEGSRKHIATIKTSGYAPGTTFAYKFTGKGITDEDFGGTYFGEKSAQGWTTIGNDGFAYITHTIATDYKTEGDEIVRIDLARDAKFVDIINNSSTFVIKDTSRGPSYSVSSPAEVNEGSTLLVTIKTMSQTASLNPNKAGNQQYLAWKITGEGFEPGDLDGSYSFGGGGIGVNRYGDDEVTLSIPVKDEGKVEKQEQWKFTLYSRMESSSEYEVASAIFNVNDAGTIKNTYVKYLVKGALAAGSSPTYNQNSFESKFYNLGDGRYGIQQKGRGYIDEITGASILKFNDQAISLANDVAATFDQVTGINDVSGVVFRLYNAAFTRLPDAVGLKNWIASNNSAEHTYTSTAKEFAASQEFKNRYGSTTTDTQYITTLYNNVLGRAPDYSGLAHYQSLLSSGRDRGALLLDFSESPENYALFTKVTGLSQRT